MAKANPREARKHRHDRLRAKLQGTESRPRLCVFRSLNHISAQVIDDGVGHTLASASSIDPEIIKSIKGKKKVEKADAIGSFIAKRAIDKGIKKVIFDRGGYKYHGRVKALADAARKAGLDF
jgi:large subunit ribosomal protein L18